MMAISIGERVPDTVMTFMTDEGPQPMLATEIFGGRNVVLFALPGAFTPTCHNLHVPGYMDHVEAFKDKGIDTIACTSVNDVFVMDAWARQLGAHKKIMFLADGNADFAKGMGLDVDSSAFGMGTRSKRYAAVIDDGVVQVLRVEAKNSEAVESGAEAILAEL
jgi:peroxiredoxin